MTTPPSNTARRTTIICLALASVVVLSGCKVGKTSWGRMAMRGPAYKRLIPTYTEAVGLQSEIDSRYEDEADAGATGDRLAAIAGLRDDVEQMRDDAHRSMELRRRMLYHRVRMDRLWSRYERMFPSREIDLRYAYKKERLVDRDEIRMRRTPLTHEMRFSVLNFESWDIKPQDMGVFDVNGEPAISKDPLSRKWTQWEHLKED